MRMTSMSVAWVLAFLFSACATAKHDTAHAAVGQTPAPASAPANAAKNGVFTPTNCAAIALWTEAYEGSLLVLEVSPHGAIVKEGDVIARLETRGIDDQIHDAELEVHSSEVRHKATLEKHRLEDDAERLALVRASAALDRAKRALEGWESKELAFTKRGDELQKKWEEAGVDDQNDELRELEKMYKADELVDATEDIVLKRAQRRLALTLTSNGLSRDRATFRTDLEQALETERRRDSVHEQEEGVVRLVASQEVERRSRQDAQVRSADALAQQQKRLERLRRDRELFTLHAPRAGVLLHGRALDYQPGNTPPRHARASQLALRTDLFVIADPAPSAVALEITDAELAKTANGSGAVVRAVAAGAADARGVIAIEAYPRKMGGNENLFGAQVKLEHPLPGALYGARALVTLDAKAHGTDG